MDDRRTRFENLVLPHLDAAYNLARWLSRSEADADDIVQDAMLRAYRAFDNFRGEAAKPWLLAILRNCWRDRLQDTSRRRAVSLEEAFELASDAPDPESLAAQASERRRLDAAIAQLPEEFREVLILREMEEMAYREIADILACPIGTVMSRLARARALLREIWLAAPGGAS